MSIDRVDGRVERRERNRAAVVEAMVSLLDEGAFDVTLERAAERAGVSVRSVFRYFDGVDDLRRQTAARHFAVVDERLRHLDPAELDRDARVAAFVEDRVAMFAANATAARFAHKRAEFIPIVAEHIARVRERLTDHVRESFALELASLPAGTAEDLVAVVDVAVSQDGWDSLRELHRRDRADVERLWIDLIARLLPEV
jgi:AcrR family transcriptional regulator